jgi:hypothetical protein
VRPAARICAIAALAAALFAPAAARAADPAGTVHFVKRTDTAFDRYTARPSAGFRGWMRARFWRAVVYTPYFDARTRWYPGGWVYLDLYAIHRGGALAREHPEWILRDAAGRRLSIPWGCETGRCPQYAGDVTDAGFRRHWIAMARGALRHGYRGLWIDDVNLERRVSDSAGRPAEPVDARGGRPLTVTTWQRAVTRFVEEVRTALPAAEIVHNAIWYAGAERLVRRQVAAADLVNLERGVNDAGLTGGDGRWSLRRLLAHVDGIHAQGRGVILDGFDASPAGRELSLAAYFLVSGGGDAVGLAAATPERWWRGFEADLGEALGPRFESGGVLRRDFTGGTVLVSEPGAPARRVELPAPMVDLGGRRVTAVSVEGGRGAVLRTAWPPEPLSWFGLPSFAERAGR